MKSVYRHAAPYIFLTFLILPLTLQAQHVIDKDIVSVTESIKYDYFFKHLKYLASDELRGRGVGTPEYTLAAHYVADELKHNGLEPFGDENTYFQEVELSKLSIQKSAFNLKIKNRSGFVDADYGSDISVVMSPKHQKINEEQQMVFVGYGNIIPEKNINDYKGVDVRGKTVIVALGGPKGMKHPSFGDRNVKFKNAVANGAKGLILFYPKAGLLQNTIFKKVHGFLSREMLTLSDTLAESTIGHADLKLMCFAKKQLVKDIFRLNALSFRQALRAMTMGKNVSKAFSSAIHCSYDLNSQPIKSKNVVALLPGTDSCLKNEYIVLSAHLDGFGIGKSIRGDSIYNGMLDNASGVSALLSISKAFNELKLKPRRSVIFAYYTAEENGLLGSSYFASRNRANHGKIVANINIDMLAWTIETTDMAVLGYAHSNLSEAADFAADQLSVKIDDNRQAEMKYIERSDQIAFLRKETPVLFITGGLTAIDRKINGEKVFNKWMKKTYHSPFDDLEQDYSDKAFLTAVKFNF